MANEIIVKEFSKLANKAVAKNIMTYLVKGMKPICRVILDEKIFKITIDTYEKLSLFKEFIDLQGKLSYHKSELETLDKKIKWEEIHVKDQNDKIHKEEKLQHIKSMKNKREYSEYRHKTIINQIKLIKEQLL